MRLSLESLSDLPANVTARGYARGDLTNGIVHLGVGAFHRAHQAVYIDQILDREPNWAILGVSLRNPTMRDALRSQDYLYTVCARGADKTRYDVIASLTDMIVAPEDPRAVLDRLCDPATRIVSLTITEKGYCHDPATGHLQEDHPDIVRDLATPDRPATALGFLAGALARRRAEGTAPFTVMSCDNLPGNGNVAGRALCRYATLCDPDLGAWMRDQVAFPNTMIDRIAPATTDADRAALTEATGLVDAWPVVTEPFSQWVIEDNFPSGRPTLETTGAELVADVVPYEHMKLRMLNGSHSALAYLGYLAGHETVSAAMDDDPFEALVHQLMTAFVMPTLTGDRASLEDYRDRLIDRFKNPGLRHKTWQIAMDGSQKLPQRLLDTIRDRIAAGAPFDLLALAVAAWMRYVTGRDEHGAPIDVRDPMAGQLRDAATGVADARMLCDRLLAFDTIFGAELPNNEPFKDQVATHLASLMEHGARRTVAEAVAKGTAS